MKTLESRKQIKIGMELRFAEVWNGNGDGKELLQSCAISPDNENVVAFDIVENAGDVLDTVVKVTDIY